MRNFSIVNFLLLFYFIIGLLQDFVNANESIDLEESPKIFIVRQPNVLSPLLDDLYAKRALPYSDLVFEKRAPIPYSGGIYGKRSMTNYKRARELPFSGGIYGKRAASLPFSGGIYGKRSGGMQVIKSRSMPFMPLSGGIYG